MNMTLILQDSMKGWLLLLLWVLVWGVEGQEVMMVVDFTQLIVNTTFNGTFDQDRIRGKCLSRLFTNKSIGQTIS